MSGKEAARDAAREMRDAIRREPFVQGGLNQLVKVLPLLNDDVTRTQRVSGYVTLERFLLGRTPSEIESALGLKLSSLRSGCRVFALHRQPGPSEIDYELTTEYPDGVAFTVLSNPDYPPGDKRFIHQWRLKVAIAATLLQILKPGARYAGSQTP
jgi:hypothetical protein